MQPMTGATILIVLEQVADNLFDPDPYLQSGGDMVRVGGLDYTINPVLPLGSRITGVKLDNGGPLDVDKEYQVSGWAVCRNAARGTTGVGCGERLYPE